MVDRLAAPTMHPFIQYRVTGYRTARKVDGIVQKKPEAMVPEAYREYHIGMVYPHKPTYEGVEYKEEWNFGASFSDEYLQLFKASLFSCHDAFQLSQQYVCPECNPKIKAISVEKNLKDYQPLKNEKFAAGENPTDTPSEKESEPQ